MLTEREALDECRSAGARPAGGFLLSVHALERMRQRRVARQDVAHALATATNAQPQENGKWKLTGGVDTDNEPLVLLVAIENRVVVVTVY